MKTQAVYITAPGKLEIREDNLPDPGPDQIQVKCAANGICMFEVSVFLGKEPWYPTAAGHEGVGVVTKLGKNAKNIKEGDWVATTR